MKRQLIAVATALALAVGSIAPAAYADDRHRGYRGSDYHDRYDRRYDGRRGGYYRHRDRDDGDAVAAGVVGLVLGLAIGSLASQPRDRQAGCYDNYQRCAPPQGYYERGYQQGGYDDRRSAYERDYGYAPPQGGYDRTYDPGYDNRQPECTRRERQWDRYARQYVVVDVPC